MSYLNEIIVLDYYLELLEKEQIDFLAKKPNYANRVKAHIIDLRNEQVIHNKIEISLKLWKVLFESAMTYIDPDKRGYDKLFDYFDKYVQFEELIFASDSFYRDHTLHCLWVYFLGEYIYYKPEFEIHVEGFKNRLRDFDLILDILNEVNTKSGGSYFERTIEAFKVLISEKKYVGSIRCLAALTHDLGYPIKKIAKINRKIKEVLPYFSIKTLDEFNFKYDEVQQMHIKEFINILSRDFLITNRFQGKTHVEDERVKKIQNQLFIFDSTSSLDRDFVRQDFLDFVSKEDLEFIDSLEVVKCEWITIVESQLNYLVDFEEYNHGIMSAYLLVKLINSLSSFKMNYSNRQDIGIRQLNKGNFIPKREVLKAVTNHTCKSYQIESIEEYSDFLILIDELEEFSRISRANKNRQYVNEFCKSNIYTEEDFLCVDFTFDNKEINDLNPEFAFKGRCKRFLELFMIPDLDENLKIRLRCIGDLPSNNSVYELQIGRKLACIKVDDVEQSIPDYLNSTQFYTREEYANL